MNVLDFAYTEAYTSYTGEGNPEGFARGAIARPPAREPILRSEYSSGGAGGGRLPTKIAVSRISRSVPRRGGSASRENGEDKGYGVELRASTRTPTSATGGRGTGERHSLPNRSVVPIPYLMASGAFRA